jgi:pantothenate kinase
MKKAIRNQDIEYARKKFDPDPEQGRYIPAGGPVLMEVMMGTLKALKTEKYNKAELNKHFIRYMKYLENTTSDVFCEHFGILEYCARDGTEYRWYDRVIENLEIVEKRYPELYIKMMDNLLVWLKIVANHSKETEGKILRA